MAAKSQVLRLPAPGTHTGGCGCLNKTAAVKLALENELRRIEEALPLRERLRSLQNRVLARPATGLEADKAFYDDMNEDS